MILNSDRTRIFMMYDIKYIRKKCSTEVQFSKIFYLYPYNNHLNPFLDSMPHRASRMSPEGSVSFYRQSVDLIHRIDAFL